MGEDMGKHGRVATVVLSALALLAAASDASPAVSLVGKEEEEERQGPWDLDREEEEEEVPWEAEDPRYYFMLGKRGKKAQCFPHYLFYLRER